MHEIHDYTTEPSNTKVLLTIHRKRQFSLMKKSQYSKTKKQAILAEDTPNVLNNGQITNFECWYGPWTTI